VAVGVHGSLRPRFVVRPASPQVPDRGDQRVSLRAGGACNSGPLAGDGSDLRRVEAQDGDEAQDGVRPRTATDAKRLQRTNNGDQTLN
jgi:hypothetical protein